jgi:hypothetical protein
MTFNDWLAAALDQQSYALANLIASLPASTSQQQAVNLAANKDLESRVYAMRVVSQEHAVGGNPQVALLLALVGLQYCKRCYALYGPGLASSFVFGVGQFAADAHRIYDRLDKHQDQIVLLDDAITWLKASGGSPTDITNLQFLRIEAMIEGGMLEHAEAALKDEAKRGGRQHFLFGMLERRLEERLIESTELQDRRTLSERAGQNHKQTLRDAIQSFTMISPEFGASFEKLFEQLEGEPGVLTHKEVIVRSNKVYEQLGSFLGNIAGGSGGQFELNAAIQRASSILADDQQGQDPTQLRQVKQTLEQVRQQATDLGFADTVEDTLWPLYLCNKRLGNVPLAIAALQEIREYVRQHREQIADPLKRAGVAQKYPYLYVELCRLLAEENDSRAMLSVIEEAKGRALADQLAIDARRENLPLPSEEAAEWLPQFVSELGVHYLTFLMDTECTYAVLAAKDGSLHAGIIPFGEAALQSIRRSLDPSFWGKRMSIFERNPEDIAQRLSPLISWLEPLVEAGLLREGDHVCYSPEGLLHLVPLQYIDFQGMPFVVLCSLSRYHCAVMLWHVTRQPSLRPAYSLAVVAPTGDEAVNHPEKVTQLRQAPNWLAEQYGASVIEDSRADLPTLARQSLHETVVHFATHGIFPDPQAQENQNPYYHSGLVLAKSGRLPGKERDSMGLLTPERVIKQGSSFNFSRSHVTLQACVSGLSEKGAGGDALGLEWSLLMSGASSVMSTHWNVNVDTSGGFFIRFYDNWLKKGFSRAQAWRRAMLSMMDPDNPFQGSGAYHWAPFSLAGDWR